ncbi:MAG: site-specific DNA-methyltransferase [Clostridia bacterium]|nr:site-specific DNA-methyltransferase [Clostridia bacterium]
MDNTIQMNLFQYFLDEEKFSIQEATNLVKNVKQMSVNNESIRARIYEGVEKGIFSKVSRGVYKVTKQIGNDMNTCLLINGDGRDLSMINDKSIDGIITDHPYDLSKALIGGNRKFATYELFQYESKDFKEKQRVLKDGAFLVEFLPEESELNFEYLYQIKKLAIENGLKYFAKVPWKKGNFVSNTGRKSKNTEEIIIFSNGEPRCLKIDAKKNLAVAKEHQIEIKGKSSYEIRDMLQEKNLPVYYMKGTNGMLPTNFDYQPKNANEKIMESEKPIGLLEEIIEYISKPYETLLDQFAGSGNFVIACSNKSRSSVAIEKDKNMFEKMKKNIEENLNVKFNELIENDEMEYE